MSCDDASGEDVKPYYQDEAVVIYHGDCRDILLDIDSVDLVVTDPPYGISFMGKSWDKALPDRKIWEQCLRVLKPGGFAFVMCIPRADCLSRMIISLEDAGFLVNFTPIFWAYASGFPKAQNIGKAVDKRNGRNQDTYKPFGDYLKERRKIAGMSMAQIDKALGTNTAYSWWEGRLSGVQLPTKPYYLQLKEILGLDNRFDELIEREEAEREIIGKGNAGLGKNIPAHEGGFKPNYNLTLSATPQAKALDGSYGGFQPKPAVEVIIVAMKPLSEKTFVDQALKNRKGITWLDDCRVPIDDIKDKEHRDSAWSNHQQSQTFHGDKYGDLSNITPPQGRFPANLLVSDDALNDGKVRKSSGVTRTKGGFYAKSEVFHNADEYRIQNYETAGGDSGSFSRYFDLDKCQFLIVPKASKGEKDRLLDGPRSIEARKNAALTHVENRQPSQRNTHPTVKPLKLMSYLITLGSREGDIILDPFMGSGTTLLAAQQMGRRAIGIEMEEKYCEIAKNRMSQGVMSL